MTVQPYGVPDEPELPVLGGVMTFLMATLCAPTKTGVSMNWSTNARGVGLGFVTLTGFEMVFGGIADVANDWMNTPGSAGGRGGVPPPPTGRVPGSVPLVGAGVQQVMGVN